MAEDKPPRIAKPAAPNKRVVNVDVSAPVIETPVVDSPVLETPVAVEEPKRYMVSEGEQIEVKVEYINGNTYLSESVWKEVPLPFSNNRTTKILIAAKGTRFYG